MKIKNKTCDGCHKSKPIWKNYGRKKYCQGCWKSHESNNPKKPTIKQYTISPRSSKRSAEEREYSKLRIDFLKKLPFCEACLPGCTYQSTDVHHKAGKIGKLLLDITKWLSVCRTCHSYIELHPHEAKELGFSLSRL